jgi:hypothetical protein
MGKRSDFERKERDLYQTPYAAVVPLLPHLPEIARFDEPCVGDGDLVKHLECHGHKCFAIGDIFSGQDALDIIGTPADMFITNPPWNRKILHRIILHLSAIRPTWLLFDADWMHTKQASEYMEYCRKIVSVGRVKWIPDSPHTGKDNCAWYLFTKERTAHTEFYGRVA